MKDPNVTNLLPLVYRHVYFDDSQFKFAYTYLNYTCVIKVNALTEIVCSRVKTFVFQIFVEIKMS